MGDLPAIYVSPVVASTNTKGHIVALLDSAKQLDLYLLIVDPPPGLELITELLTVPALADRKQFRGGGVVGLMMSTRGHATR